MIPRALRSSIQKGYVISIIQFGSSLYRKDFRDIDLAVIIRYGCYEKFLKEVFGAHFKRFDISLIKEEEISGSGKFRFGGHGAHFLSSLANGRALYGNNPFKYFLVSPSQIRKSVLLRLYDYIEDVRRAVFKGNVQSSIKRRWPKFLKLSLYLLDADLQYFRALNLNEKELAFYLKKYRIGLRGKNLLVKHEKVWELVLKKYHIISDKIKQGGRI